MDAAAKWLDLLAVLVAPLAALFTDRYPGAPTTQKMLGTLTGMIVTAFWSGIYISGHGMSSAQQTGQQRYTITVGFPSEMFAEENAVVTFNVQHNERYTLGLRVEVNTGDGRGFTEWMLAQPGISNSIPWNFPVRGAGTQQIEFEFRLDYCPCDSRLENNPIYRITETVTVRPKRFRVTMDTLLQANAEKDVTLNAYVHNDYEEDISAKVYVKTDVGVDRSCPGVICAKAGQRTTVPIYLKFYEEGLANFEVVASTSAADRTACDRSRTNTNHFSEKATQDTLILPSTNTEDDQCT